MNDELNLRAPAQPEPAAPTPDTFMGEPVLTRWKPLNRDDSRLALHQSMHNRSFGNPSDDKLMLEWLWENGYALCKRVPDEAAPTEATLDQMANTAWDRFQSHTVVLQALENCRLYAARHRKEEWSAVIRRFCFEGGAIGSPLREAAPTVVEPVAHCALTPAGKIAHFDGRPMVMIGSVGNEHHPTPLYATPPRAALTDEQIDALDTHALYWMAPRQRDSVRAFARAVIAADRGQP